MKHDIIDRDTGNIVGVISLTDNSIAEVIADLTLAHRLISELQARLGALETDVIHLGANLSEHYLKDIKTI